MVSVPPTGITEQEPQIGSENALLTMYDLPSEDPEEPGLPDEFHDLQPQLLSRTLRLLGYSRQQCFTASDLNLYYDVKHPLWHKRPDWFLVVGVSRLYQGKELRRSYVTWQEKRAPKIIVEFLSPGTESEDLGRFYEPESNGEQQAPVAKKRSNRSAPADKFEVYEKYLQVPHYIVYSRYTQQLRYFQLEGDEYQEQSLKAENPKIWLADLEVGLGIWQGEFEGVPSHWLRWCDGDGNWLLTDTEQERQEKEQERREKEQALQQAQQARLEQERAQAQLRQVARHRLASGMTVSQVAQMLDVSEAEVLDWNG